MVNLRDQSLRGLQRQAASQQSGVVDTSVWLEVAQIIVDEAIQVRQTGLDGERVEQYALAMIEYGGYGEFPPLVVFRDPQTDELYLAGGFHRRAAIDRARQGLIEDGKPPIEVVPCEVRTGDRQAAVEFAEDDNLQHGLNLTNRDKRAIYERRIIEGHVWSEYSNRRVASELGVSEITIRRWRDDLTATNVAVDEPDTRIGSDGRRIDVSGIQAANAQRVADKPHPPAPSPRSGEGESSRESPSAGVPSGAPQGADEGTLAALRETARIVYGRAEPVPQQAPVPVVLGELRVALDAVTVLRERIKGTVAALDGIPPEYDAQVRGLSEELLEVLEGWSGADGQWYDGVVKLLGALWERLGEEGE